MKHTKIYLPKIDSTNNYVLKNITNLDDKNVVYAGKQTAGKGRNNRVWVSSQQANLYFTIVLKFETGFKKISVLPNITQYMAVVLCRIFKKYAVDARIKWPNDILVDGKKIVGILCETVFKGSDLQGMALGVGVNLNMTEDFLQTIDQPATALNVLIGKKIDRKKFLDELLDEFFENYNNFLNDDFLSIRDEYKKNLISLNKQVKVNIFDEIYEGRIKDVDFMGQLILEQKNGDDKVVNIGDVIINFNRS
jgi:BirA family biotin operon repressor/biotin-[acetyl-CoA-carboxylase] ligase